ncbi:MAG TPA: NADPH:quinone reductase [Planctomycetaceae bacterium]|jgi:NADPH2:quinone reductase|nr:NADPH:quinone reductase [Planctomycetaceae bacterium]
MKAAYITQTGPPDVIQYGELPDPKPGPTQVLVKVGAVSVNPIDTYIRSGAVPAPLKFPYIIGSDLAGTVVACGSEVRTLKPGDRVWGSNQGVGGRTGSFAELAAVDERWLYPTPTGQSDAEAAAGALVGITAHLGVFLHAGLNAGETLLVNGGTGGVGSAVVQLAKWAGARVIATVGSEEKKKLCASWGTDLVLDYHSPTLDEEIRKFAEPAGGIDVWFETQREPTLDRAIPMMATRGRIVLLAGRAARPELPVGPFYIKDLRLVGFTLFNASADEQRASAKGIRALAERGGWHPIIGKKLPLAEAAAAHRLQEESTLHKKGALSGKIVLQLS